MIQRLKQLGIDAFFDVQPNESGVRLESAAKLNRIRTAAVGDIIGRYDHNQ